MSDANTGRELYYGGRYWNDLPLVRRHLDRRATGSDDVTWVQSLASGGRRFGRALVLNCGNGWVERDLHIAGLVDEVVGIDINNALLEEATIEAVACGLSARYVQMDINTVPLPDGPFDLVLNHAAGHHITHIDRVFQQVAARLSSTGTFVSWDYVGPHRNQYPEVIWDAAQAVNDELPPALRNEMAYPNIETMLATDPSEAVHSELVLTTIERHFDIVHLARLGGAIGYLLLSHNEAIHTAPPEQATRWITRILEADTEFVEAHPDHTLFAFVVAKPASNPPSIDECEQWRQAEDDRERRARSEGGEYGPRTALSDLAHGPRPTPSRLGRWAQHRFPRATGRYNRIVDYLLERLRTLRMERERRRRSQTP